MRLSSERIIPAILLLILLEQATIASFNVCRADEPSTTTPSTTTPSTTTPNTTTPNTRQTHEGLHSTLWTQGSLERIVQCEQAYTLAAIRLKKAIKDSSWTACLEQVGEFSKLPPAVILDLDETVMDNAAFQARLTRDKQPFSEELWKQWVLEEQAGLVPGARQFIELADKKNVRLFFVTNREFEVEQATVNNLNSLLDIKITNEQVLSKNERPDWSSAKKNRRSMLARSPRILLLIGEDFNDFAYLGKVAPDERRASGRQYVKHWGVKWIQLPNPMYGNWEKALYRYDYGLTDEEKLRIKQEMLETDELEVK